MKKVIAVSVAALFVSSALAITPTLDGVLDEWVGPDVINIGSEPGPTGGAYTAYLTYDLDALYLGVDRDSTDRYLGDQSGVTDNFFLAIDVDGIAGSGATSDGYGRVDFAGPMLPDFIYYFAGGGGWYERGSWNGAGWDWLGWTNADTYYGWTDDPGDPHPNDEMKMWMSEIGGGPEVTVWAWMTLRDDGNVYASWPTGHYGDDPNPVFGDGIYIPEPASLALLAIGGLLVLRRR